MLKKIFLLIVFLLICPLSTATSIANLYQIDVPVVSQDETVRQTAIQTGLVEIFVKLTGDAEVKNNPVLKSSIEKPEFYMQEYSYLPNPSGDGFKLQIKYDAKSINRLLKRNDIPFWSDNRPLVLMWLAYKAKDQPLEMIGNENPKSLLGIFASEAKGFGMPVIFPMMDLTDINQLNSDSLIKIPNDTFIKASKRYTPNAMLVGDIISRDGSLYSDWKLILDDKQWTWTIKREKMDELANEIMYQASQTLAKQYVMKPAAAEPIQLTLEINQVTEKDDLAKLMKFLKQLSGVQEVELLGLNGDVVQVNVTIRGTLEAFQENAALGRRIVLKSHDLENNKLYYEWSH